MTGLLREDDGRDLQLQERLLGLRELQAQDEDLRHLQEWQIHLQKLRLGADGRGHFAQRLILIFLKNIIISLNKLI